jgi:hypothetical protein
VFPVLLVISRWFSGSECLNGNTYVEIATFILHTAKRRNKIKIFLVDMFLLFLFSCESTSNSLWSITLICPENWVAKGQINIPDPFVRVLKAKSNRC